MKFRIKRIFACLLAIVLFTSALPLCTAADLSLSNSHAKALNTLGVFQGTSAGYDLESAPNRAQGITMLIRLLGKEADALKKKYSHPFTDAQDWSKPYVAYAYEKGLTKGAGNNLFGDKNPLGVKDYVTFLLRALGYNDGAGDFSWDTSLQFAQSIGMITSEGVQELAGKAMLRNDMVDLSYAAMFCKMANGKQTLAEKLQKDGVFTKEQGEKAGVLKGKAWAYGQILPSPVTYTRRTVSGVSVDVIRVDLNDPTVRVEVGLANDQLGTHKNFAEIAKESGALAVINGNFFNSGSDLLPIGSLVAGGEALYTMHGNMVFGVNSSGDPTWGRPFITVWLKGEKSSKQHWIARSVNVDPDYHTTDYSVMYTPMFGTSVTVNCSGQMMVVQNDVVTEYTRYTAGEAIDIPADGYILLMGTELLKASGYKAPKIGERITTEIYSRNASNDPFEAEDLYSAVTGAPCLVEDGSICTVMDVTVAAEKFTVMSTPRTAVGTTSDDILYLVSCSAATIDQMKQVMLELGCENAVNLDGGGSCAMYYDGKVLHTPGRKLTSTLQIFID